MKHLVLPIFVLAASLCGAQTVQPSTFDGLHWRLAGPFRGGRALTACGVPGQPDAFYSGAVGGGVWYTENAGRTWTPIFDKEPVASIGAIAVAPGDPKVIYVGSGEADMRSDIQQGDGIYRSSDGGKTWVHIGLSDTRQIGKILVDPKDPNIVYVAALGHQYGPNAERGVFKSVDGGATWTKSLFKDANTGAIDLDFEPQNSKVIYASLWQTRRPPWSVYPPSNGPGSGLYKSDDAGATWRQIKGGGFPEKVGRVGISVSPANPQRVYVCVDAPSAKDGGVYRSDDAGQTWTHVGTDGRIWGRGWYFCGITADPKNPDEIYVMNTSAYRSTDGGNTWTAFKGAPGGDDYHACWIAPDNPSRMILAADQGTVVTVDGGKTWSSWYNQPTGQFYHIITDNRFPYWIYGSQQDSGGMAIPSRTIHTGISALYDRPIDAGGESGTIAPDPLHKGLLYSSFGTKEDIETGWEQNIDPTNAHPETFWRSEWTQPIVISPADPKVIYTSHQKIFRSEDGGSSWSVISPDLTREKLPSLANLDAPTAADNDGVKRPGVVYWLAPSPLKAKTLWAGTDDGLVWLTRDDGVHWNNVTPKELTAWSKVGMIDAGHFSADTAYAAIDRHRVDDNHPYIYRTHDGGKSWKLITKGIPNGQFVNVVREDPKQPGLLYAGTDWAVYVSFNDGNSWQSLQLNLPPASMRDIVFGGDDVVVGTHGRAIWILDDVSMLRQLAAGAAKPLFKPAKAVLFQRVGTFGFGRFDEGTPLPQEEPVGENAPWGAILDYFLSKKAASVVLTISNDSGMRIRKFSSADAVHQPDPSTLDIPAYWLQPQPGIATAPGGHRFVWDFRYESGQGPLVPPGSYLAKLVVDGKVTEQRFTVARDPRISASDADLRAQWQFAMQIVRERDKVRSALSRAQAVLKQKHSAAALAKIQSAMGKSTPRYFGAPPSSDVSSLSYVADALDGLMQIVESAPAAPTRDAKSIFATLQKKADADMATMERLKDK